LFVSCLSDTLLGLPAIFSRHLYLHTCLRSHKRTMSLLPSPLLG
jgi:hypothetical protein